MSRSTVRWLLGSLAAVACLADLPARAAVPPPVLEDRWVRVSTPHFRVFGNTDRKRTIEIARRLERLQEVLDQLQPEMRITNAEPLPVYSLEGEGTFRHFKLNGVENLTGYTLTLPTDNLLVLDAETDERDALTMYHELTHAYLHTRFQSLPLWLNEGMAQYYSTFVAGDRTADIGRALPGAKQWCRNHSMLDFDRLFEITQDSPQYRSGDARATFYYQSWVLVSMLNERSATDGGKFFAYLNRLLAGQSPITAFNAVYPRATWPALQKDLSRFVQRDEHPYWTYTFAQKFEAAAAQVEVVAPPAALVDAGDLLLALHESGEPTLENATACYRAALEREPEQSRALARLGLVEDIQGHSTAAESLYSVAYGADPNDANACLTAGRGVMKRLERLDAKGGESPERGKMVMWARQRFTCALRRDPTRVAALVGYGHAACLDRDAPSDPVAIQALTAAFRARRDRVDLLWNLLDQAERTGRQTAVDSVLDYMSDRIPKAELDQWRAQRSQRDAHASVQLGIRALNAERYAEAQLAFEDALRVADTPTRQEIEPYLRRTRARSVISQAHADLIAGRALQAETFLDSLLASATLDSAQAPELGEERDLARHLRADAAFKRWADAGVAHAGAGRLAEARDAFRKALAQARDDERKAYAERMLRELGEPGSQPDSKADGSR